MTPLRYHREMRPHTLMAGKFGEVFVRFVRKVNAVE